MSRMLAGVAGSLLILGVAAWSAVADDPPKAEAGAQGIAQPTAEHAVLKSEVGNWDATIKSWMPGSEDPVESKGSESNHMLGGMWLISNFRGDMGGMPFQGHGVYGYDPDKKKYTCVWIDNMTAKALTLEGTYDAAKKSITLEGEMEEPGTGNKVKIRNTTTTKSDSERVFEMFMEMPGQPPMKLMEVTYTKTADGAAKKK